MVKTFGSDIEKVFTGGEPVEAIYAEGVKVWPTTSSGEYYIKWWPKDLSGSFTIGGETRWLQDYSGYYSGPFLSTSYGGRVTPSAYYIDSGAFTGTGVVAIETNLKLIGPMAFDRCESLVFVSASQCVSFMIANNDTTYTFGYCSSLREIYCDELGAVGQFGFTQCDNLIYVSLPKCTGIAGWAFQGCDLLEHIELPSCTFIATGAFQNCSRLEVVDLPVCSVITESAFKGCSSLSILTLGYSGVCSMSGAVPVNTDIFVPLEWVSEYKSTYPYHSSHIFPIQP